MKHISLTLTASVILGIASASAQQNVLAVSNNSMDPSFITPSPIENATRALQENWYLQNFVDLDTPADNGGDDFSESVIIDRLSRIPSVIEMPYNSVVGNCIRFYANRKDLVAKLLGLSLYYMPIFEEALQRHNMPRELKYLPVIESALDPTAISRAGAGGLWQFMPDTGRGLGLEQNSLVDMRFDPYKASEAGAKYLKQLYEMYNDWSLAIAAYNCGPGNVNKALRRLGDGNHDFWEIYPFLPAETRGYLPTFIAAVYIMTYHKNHNISTALARRPLAVDTVHVSRRVHFDQIAEVLEIPKEEIRALNPQYIAEVIPGDIKPYSLTLPSLQAYAYVANEDTIVNHNAANYRRRDIVEPGIRSSGTDARGEYVQEETIVWHTVKRGETLTSIANRYNTTVSEIRQTNHCGKRVQRGQRLKIKTITRRYVTAPTEQPIPTEAVQPTDSTAVAAVEVAAADSTGTAAADVQNAFAPVATPAPEPVQNQAPARASAQTQTPAQSQSSSRRQQSQSSSRQNRRNITHVVRRGENLTKIARRYGVTVNAIKQANNIRGDEIRIGQRLTIPQ